MQYVRGRDLILNLKLFSTGGPKGPAKGEERMNVSRAAYNFLAMAVMAVLVLIAGRPALAAKDPWPKRFEHPKGTVVMYQPQLEDFTEDRLTARAAVSVQTKEIKTPVFGAIWLTARVAIDRDTRMATIEEAKVTEAKFPSAVDATPEQLEKLKAFLNTEMADLSFAISLDKLLAAMDALQKSQARDQNLKNDPPKIIFATHPTVLVPLDGEPKLLPVPQSPLMRVANTPFIMLYEPSSKAYFLRGGDRWLGATDLKGPWQDVATLPASLKAIDDKIQKEARAGGGQAPPKKVEKDGDKMPGVIVSTEPAEILVTEGEPQYTPIAGTNLLYVSNTGNNIFMDTAAQEYYALLSGRWFKTKSLAQGPWAYVAPDKLPGDFAKIPESSVKGFVLVNVAGTTQAKEAVLENNIPQTAVIDRKKASTKVEYAGPPKFEKIAETNLEYAVNAGASVFKEGTKYYALDQGVWYEADSPNGPWKVSASPPREVDKIPPSNPNYNAKYVKVYDTTEDTVTVGYTPGYTGSYVDNGTVVYGTGYSYQGYASADSYIPAPATYGYAAAYNPYSGSWGSQPSYYNPAGWLAAGAVGLAAGMAIGASTHWWGPGPYWHGGGWWGPGGYNNININNIHNNVINPRPYWHGGRPIYHPVVSPHNRNNIYNRPINQNNLAHRGGRPDIKPSPGPGPKPGPGPHPGPGPGPKPGPGPHPGPPPKSGQTKVKPGGGPNNVIADKNGHVYKQDKQGNWQHRQGNQWAKPGGEKPGAGTRPQPRTQAPGAATRTTPAPKPQASHRPSYETGQFNREMASRQRGETRSQNHVRAASTPRPSPSPSYSRPSGAAGGHRGAGGGRRR
jgi:hypothetical protein